MTPYCEECRYYIKRDVFTRLFAGKYALEKCAHPKAVKETDQGAAKVRRNVYLERQFCAVLRCVDASSTCGPAAKWFEPKEEK